MPPAISSTQPTGFNISDLTTLFLGMDLTT